MMPLLSALPWSWRIALGAGAALLVGGSFGLGMKTGYEAGFASAKAAGDAANAALERDCARQYAEAAARNAERVRREAEKALSAVSELAKEKESHAKTYASLRAGIADVTRGSVHRFSPDFVRVFNRAVGAVPLGTAGPHDPGSAPAGAGAGASAGSGVLRDDNPAGRGLNGKMTAGSASMEASAAAGFVTEKDVLAYIVYYGKRCKDMEAQLRALVHTVGGKHERN